MSLVLLHPKRKKTSISKFSSDVAAFFLAMFEVITLNRKEGDA